jgi:hypothetical protein
MGEEEEEENITFIPRTPYSFFLSNYERPYIRTKEHLFVFVAAHSAILPDRELFMPIDNYEILQYGGAFTGNPIPARYLAQELKMFSPSGYVRNVINHIVDPNINVNLNVRDPVKNLLRRASGEVCPNRTLSFTNSREFIEERKGFGVFLRKGSETKWLRCFPFNRAILHGDIRKVDELMYAVNDLLNPQGYVTIIISSCNVIPSRYRADQITTINTLLQTLPKSSVPGFAERARYSLRTAGLSKVAKHRFHAVATNATPIAGYHPSSMLRQAAASAAAAATEEAPLEEDTEIY